MVEELYIKGTSIFHWCVAFVNELVFAGCYNVDFTFHHYASPSSWNAYRDRQLTPNFKL